MVTPKLGRRNVPDGHSSWEVFPGELIRETDKALLVQIEGEDLWFPRSQVEWMDDEQEIWVPRWLAEEKELV